MATITPTSTPPGSTTLPARPTAGESRPERRRRTGTLRATDVYAACGAALASVSVTALLFTRLTAFTGTIGFVVTAYLLFLGLYALLVAQDEDGPAVRDRLMFALIHSMAVLMLSALVFVVVYTLWEGRDALRHLNFFTEDMTDAGPLEPLTVGGIRHAVFGTLIEIAVALAITIPTGLLCAVFLNEVPGRFARFVRTIVEAMTALPSVVAGLFIYAMAILALGMEKSGLAAGLAISVMMLPIIIRSADVVIRLVPGALREAAYATGAPRWRTVWHVVLPTARSGLTTSVILGTARGVGETSPVLLTAGYATATNTDPLHGAMTSLPLAAFQLVKSPEPTYIARGFGAAAVLMALVLLLFVLARLLGGRGPGQLSRRQEHRRVLGSAKDLRRIESRMAGPSARDSRQETARSQP
ncbi:phosphate ABC transporter permease PstA [Streptomyces litchfieldiae]|uniref:Phosphate transport system permease protein PstA n=1 Tax=Streptomyces litchfieldiae TaxID=3075543 RepID=A0ABU2N3I4_9ACTN|nr:phosphate ABC transporter permease PstA [Streptomyces sp. DSM 44938]MDT0347274.1 phosphate ABC transporter permease PstA [Streptomyces sp. DSM 44938]